MAQVELIRAMLIEGAIGGAILSLIAFLLSRFVRDIVGRTLLATVLFSAAGAYLGFAFNPSTPRVWLLVELLQCIAYGTLGLYGWRGSPYWLALGWVLHPLWDFGVHHLGPGREFAPLGYVIACISFDWVVALYIVIAYRLLHLANRQAPSRAR
jgi:uncharacterized protein DUF6010